MPQTWRANSTTATCMPRQIPRYGTPRSRANRAAVILPSMPRPPKPPGTRMPSARSRAASRWRSSASTQSMCSSTPWWMAACLSASATERYASWSWTYLPTRAMRTCAVARADALHQPAPVGEVGRRRGEAEALADDPREALGLEVERDLVDVVRRRRRRSRPRRGCRRRARSCRGCRPVRGRFERSTRTSGSMPMRRSSLTECWVVLVFSSPTESEVRDEGHVDEAARAGGRRRCAAGGWPRGRAATRCRPPSRRSRR